MDLPSTHFFSNPRPTLHPAPASDTSPPHPPPMDLPSTHFLSQPRPTLHHPTQINIQPNVAPNIVDTTTLAAHDFDVDTSTGFMPRTPPLARLPGEWEVWEGLFDWARFGLAEGEKGERKEGPLQLGEKKGLTDEEKRRSEAWRESVRNSPILDPTPLESSEPLLRRAHLVLAWLMHFYIHTLPPDEEVIIPKSISVPLLVVSWALQIPPVLTYSDDVLYNWHFASSSSSSSSSNGNGNSNTLPTPETIAISTTFTSTPSEAHFYLTSARIELVGVKALDLMSASLDEAFVSDSIAYRRIASYLREMKSVIGELEDVLVRVKEGCDPVVFYEEIRPWFRGEDSSSPNNNLKGAKGKWKFEALDHPLLLSCSIPPPTELSGASAGQSTLIHALDIFLGVPTNEGFQQRMKRYMPRYHRRFLEHLEGRGGSVRGLVERARRVSLRGESELTPISVDEGTGAGAGGAEGKEGGAVGEEEEMDLEVASELVDAYNEAVGALKRFRDAHLRIVALYIVGPARRGGLDRKIEEARETKVEDRETKHTMEEEKHREKVVEKGRKEKERKELKGTGGTDLVKFLKMVRDRTGETVLR